MDLVPKEIITDTVDKKLIVDGANGVGGAKLEELKKQLKGLVIHVRNSGKEGEGILNEGVGADYVQKEKVVPCGFGPNDVGIRLAFLFFIFFICTGNMGRCEPYFSFILCCLLSAYCIGLFSVSGVRVWMEMPIGLYTSESYLQVITVLILLMETRYFLFLHYLSRSS